MSERRKVAKIERKPGFFYYVDKQGNIIEMKPKGRKRR